jgi:hypothetical protein
MPRSQQRSNVYGYTVECDKCHGKKFLADGVMCWKCIEILEEYFKRKRDPVQATR